jgi:hypothetical protein
VSAEVLRARPRFPNDKTYFEVALPVELALGRLRLNPRRRSATRWSFECPVCHDHPESGALVARPDGAIVFCRSGCPRERIRRVIESATW